MCIEGNIREREHFANIQVRTWDRFTCAVDLRVLHHANHSSPNIPAFFIFMTFFSLTRHDNNLLAETDSNSAKKIRFLAFYNIESLNLVGLLLKKIMGGSKISFLRTEKYSPRTMRPMYLNPFSL